MSKFVWLPALALAGLLAAASVGMGQARPYIGYSYPAGGQQGTTVAVRLGGQNLDDVVEVYVSGTGVQGRLIDYFRRLNNQEESLMRQQLRELKPARRGRRDAEAPPLDAASQAIVDRIERRQAEYVNTPACASIANLAFVEVTVAADAPPGPREIRLVTSHGASNPLVFHVGQVPEYVRPPMKSATLQVLGKEEGALRKRPPEEAEQRVALPCVVNGQIASGEMNLYRFEARKGQKLVISAVARQLIPYLADAVPGWFQPVLTLYDAAGKEVAYNDDYRFRPDPLIQVEVPADGEYVLAVTDAIYRGREDFVYRVAIGETPLVTSVFPLGGKAGETPTIEIKGWNLDGAQLAPPPADAAPGFYRLTATRNGIISNQVPFVLDTLPERVEKEGNNDTVSAQQIELPTIVNGRIDRPDDWDVFKFTGLAGETVVAEVNARRLDSALDSALKITGPDGKLLAFNDDHEIPGSGVNTHDADSYLMVALPADGTYCVHLGDTARGGGEEYGYRLRLSAPMPDFELRAVPSSVVFRAKGSASIEVRAIRKDGYTGPIELSLKDPPEGFTAAKGRIAENQLVGRLSVKTTRSGAPESLTLHVQGMAKIGDREVVHEATPTEDRMQAFLWRHLVPAERLMTVVWDSAYVPPAKRPLPAVPPKPEGRVEPPAGLVLRFPFDQEGADGAVVDASGQNLNGRLSGGKWIAEGKIGGSCELAPGGQYIQVHATDARNLEQATFAAWIKTSKNDTVFRRIFDKQADQGFALSIGGEMPEVAGRGKLVFTVNGSPPCLSDSVVADGFWHHVAATFDGENLRLYVDGAPQKQVVPLQGEIAANTAELTVGMNRSNPSGEEATQGFEGLLDEVMIFSRALSADEIKTMVLGMDAFAGKPKFTERQVAGRIRQIEWLYQEGLISEAFYIERIQECQAGL